MRLVHLQVNKKGVRLVTSLDTVSQTLARTIVPVVFSWQSPGPVPVLGSQSGYSEKKVLTDLALTDVSSPPVRSLSPVVFTPAETGVSLVRSAAQLKRQLTFVESPGQTARPEADCQTEVVEVKEEESQTEVESAEAEVQTVESERRDVPAGTQTIPLAVSQAGVQTQPDPGQEELIPDTFPLSRSPRHVLTFSSTQTDPLSSRHMINQTSPQTSSRTRENSPSSCRLPNTNTNTITTTDEMVARVLLEHAGADPDHDSDSRQSLTASASSSSSSTLSEASGSLFSVESGRATSYDNVTNRQELGGKDLSRTVNYLDLSRLGNEGETPNSDEIWVTVEDDNKFLTSDTETYSVATDKVNELSLISDREIDNLLLQIKFYTN